MSGAITIRRKVFKIFGGAFHIFNDKGEIIGYSKQKAFKFKEDIRIYTDESMAKELITIKARNVIDFSAAYDAIDTQTNTKICAFKRKGLKSIFKDEWIIMDPNDNDIGVISEDSAVLALIRRLFLNFIPQKFNAAVNGKKLCSYKQRFNPFIFKLDINLEDTNADQRMIQLCIVGGILLTAIEGRQN
ncbi:MAG: hypothetical protein HY606_11595 [Planctomycetes bacterium]|nr:hypothetical protein [Planctomycetota bacterium]